MNVERCVAASINLNDTKWWVTGGGPAINSTEVFDESSELFFSSDDLPNGDNRYHNLVRINASHIMYLGGFPYHSDTYYYNQDTGEC